MATMVTAVVVASGVALAAKPPPPVIETGFFFNEAPITLPLVGQANPYPSTIAVPEGTEPDGFPQGSRITDVSVRFPAFSHTFPDDVDMLLVGPSGESIILMSDAGGPGPGVQNLDHAFIQDRRFSKIPNDGPLGELRATYRPANYRPSDDTFPDPDNPGEVLIVGKKANLSVFEGTNPIGSWELYVVDDVGGDVGSLPSGWFLRITAEVPPEALP
jgi:hypothetical protein